MAEVVATIILLALTVTLFSAIFAFVTSFPSPPSQSSNQFQATLQYATNSSSHSTPKPTAISGVTILHLAGPTVSVGARVYLKSSSNPNGPVFQSAYITTSNWNLGQTYSVAFPTGQYDPLGDNITIYIISQSTLLFSAILPGQSIAVPPTFLSTAVTPGNPDVGAVFNVSTVIAGTPKTYGTYITLSGIPGLTATPEKMTYSATTGTFYFVVSVAYGATTENGTYYAFINASGTSGGTASTGVPITFVTPTTSTGTLASGGPTGLLTSTQTIVTYTPSATAQFRISWTLSCKTGATTPTLKVTWTDPTLGAQSYTLYATSMATGATTNGVYTLVSTATVIAITASENTGSDRIYATVSVSNP
ncbi:MAG: type IV pilin [Thermoplasmata archaeon]